MLDALSLTDYLALMFGVYLIAAGVGLMLDGETYVGMLQEFRDNAALGYLVGIMAFSIGVVLVRLHNDWGSWVSCLVSVVGWVSLIEGVLLLAFRRQFLNLFLKVVINRSLVMGFSIVCFLLGALLLASVLL